MELPSHTESIFVRRPPKVVYDMVADVTRMGEYSPICKSCWWDDDNRGVGAWFTGHNETPERTWETRSQVVVAEPGSEFAFQVGGDKVRWGYSLEAVEGGTRLTETWNVLPAAIDMFQERYGENAQAELDNRIEAAHTGIPATLAAIKAAAEA